MGRTGILIIIFGLLDLLSFYRSAPNLIKTLEHFTPSIMTILAVLMIVSLLASGPLSIVGNKVGYVIYYFQFPLRMTFLILTFGFLFKIFQLQVGTLAYGMLMASVMALEATRLMLTIQRHRHVV